jgi:hypothetical protein
MNEMLLEAIKGEKRYNLGKRFKRWIDCQWGYERGSFKIWRVSEERAAREIAESILSDPSKRYFVYKDNTLQSLPDNYDFLHALEVDISLFRGILRDCRLNELGIYISSQNQKAK